MYRVLLFLLLLSGSVLADYSTPDSTLQTYLGALEAGDYAAMETCYTKSSREMTQARGQVAPEARDAEQLQQVYLRLKALSFRTEQVNSKRAILWPSDESIPPFFLRIQEPAEQWRIDYHFMSNYIKIKENGWNWRNGRILNLWKSRE